MYIFSLHCVTISLCSVYELNGAERLTWTHKIIAWYSIYQPENWVSVAIFCMELFYVQLKVMYITGVMMFMFCWKIISLHNIFYLYVILTCHIMIYNVSHFLVWWQKWDISLSIYLHNSESFGIMWIFSSHCITIFIYSVHELTGSTRLVWTDKINVVFTTWTSESLLQLFVSSYFIYI